ncbi:UNVERIFIED_CONTAM: hypothetical protein Slati_0404300 [Sesamum latifolium]|uniref:Uncharacterized protein n=1 Tax=Sesamum latifolium TaxID=2727402 RepID=A0AAW2XYF8_9LAMI
MIDPRTNPPPSSSQPTSSNPLPPTTPIAISAKRNILQHSHATHFQHDPIRAAKKTFQDDSLYVVVVASKYKGIPSITHSDDETSQLVERLKFALIRKFSD